MMPLAKYADVIVGFVRDARSEVTLVATRSTVRSGRAADGASFTRKMLRQMLPHFFDPRDQAGRRIALAKELLDRRGDAVPRLLTEAFVCDRVADDGELPPRRHDEEVDRVVIGLP